MATIDLRPWLPRIWTAQPRLIPFGSDLTPELGGPMQRAQHLGGRWAVSLSDLPGMEGDNARNLLGALAEASATASMVKISWPQPAYAQALGSPKVNGGSQTGTTLAIDGLPTSGIVKPGWFSVSVSSQSYLYMVTRQAQAASGAASLTVSPMLRASPADNADLEFGRPVLEGFVTGHVPPWSVEMGSWLSLGSIEIVEAA